MSKEDYIQLSEEVIKELDEETLKKVKQDTEKYQKIGNNLAKALSARILFADIYDNESVLIIEENIALSNLIQLNLFIHAKMGNKKSFENACEVHDKLIKDMHCQSAAAKAIFEKNQAIKEKESAKETTH